MFTIDPEAESGGSAMSDTKLSFCVIEDLDVMGEALADVTGVTAELPFVLALAIAFLVASFTS
jgi:prepilin signal peptidase PulO-like enzyme (type II secretory pathway)